MGMHAARVDRVIACRVKSSVTAALAVLPVLLAVSAPAGALGPGPAPDLAAAKKALTIDRAGAAAIVAAAEAAAGLTRATSTSARANALRLQARTAERAHLFTRATALHGRARDLYVKADDALRACACLTATQDSFLVASTYSATRTEMLDTLADMYPGAPAEQRAAWLGLPSTWRMRWDGVVHCFYDLPTNEYGDRGAQNMYFSALCRSVGIPARCTGGFQIFQGAPAGHFWAELYLPNCGWIPLGPTAATIADYIPGLSADEMGAFHDFFYGSRDDWRLVAQKDTDLPLIPRADGRVLLPLAVQMPTGCLDLPVDGHVERLRLVNAAQCRVLTGTQPRGADGSGRRLFRLRPGFDVTASSVPGAQGASSVPSTPR